MSASRASLPVARLAEVAFFAGCPPADAVRLARQLEVCRVRPYASLQREGEPPRFVHFVLAGEVLLQKERGPGHEPARLSIVRRGEMFGFGEIMLRTCYTTALALVSLEVARISRDAFLRDVLAVPVLRERLFGTFSDMTRILIHRAVAGDARHELAYYLRHACRENGRRVGRRIRIDSLVKQPAVASVLNLSREHVTRLFADLRREGVVDFNRGHPLVDPAWLDRMTADRDLADSLQYRDIPDPSSGQ